MSAATRPGAPAKPAKPKLSSAWREARSLIAANQGRLALGLVLLLVNRAAGMVLPWTTKLLVDDVVVNKKGELLPTIALLGVGATLVQAVTTFVLAQLLGVAAQGAINDMRKRVQAHVLRLPVRYFDDHQTGVILSRIKSDADGLRNLVGNGLVQLVGSVLTAAVALGVLFWLNARLTAAILVVLAAFGACMVWAFRTLRPLFRKRGEIEAEVTGRLNQTLGGVRVVKAYTAEPAEERVFAEGSDRFFANVRQSIRGVSMTTAASIAITGVIGCILTWIGGRDVLEGSMTIGELVMYLVFVALVALPIVGIAEIGTQITEAFAGLDRIREVLDTRREDDGDEARAPCKELSGAIELQDVSFEYVEGNPCSKAFRSWRPRARRRRSSARAAAGRARWSGSSWRSTGRNPGACSSTGATSRRCASRTTARTSASSCRTTSSSTARSRTTSRSRGRRRRAPKWRRRAGSRTATSS